LDGINEGFEKSRKLFVEFIKGFVDGPSIKTPFFRNKHF
jgi:hypothetical protein